MPPCHGQVSNNFYLAGTGCSLFSVKAMYHELADCKEHVDDRDWMQIWKASVPKRCKISVWLLKQDRILTNFSKNRKGIGSAGCKLCGNTCESTLHAVHDCSKCYHIGILHNKSSKLDTC